MKITKIILLISFSISLLYAQEIKVGSKKFTESVILGEVVTQLGRLENQNITHLRELGGTRVLWNALLKGDIDIYPEYTGTIRQEIFSQKNISESELENLLKENNVEMSKPLGFNNTYALGMKKEKAEELHIFKISDLKNYPELRFGFSNEFMDRKDGWPGLQKAYNLPVQNVNGLDHDLAYRGLDNNSIDVIDLYSTDADIDYYNLKVLKDDYHFFPDYHAVLLYRIPLKKKSPAALKSILRLEGSISDSLMIAMNAEVKIDGKPESKVAADFISDTFSEKTGYAISSFWSGIWLYTKEHLFMVAVSLSVAILFSIPLGILAYKKKEISNLILGVTGIIQTIPSLALLVFMIPLLGIGSWPAIVALFLYSLLPIVRNTYSGLQNIPQHIKESAVALGIPSAARLRLIELPLASRSILAGIKTSAVINIGTATLGALIGAGGYGQPILTGIRLDNISLILEGAVPAALLAVLVQLFFDLLEKYFVPKGLRLDE